MARDTLDAYRQLQQQIQSDIEARRVEHKRQLDDARKNFAGALVQPLNLLAVGDSWFDYPVPSLGHLPTDVIVSLTGLMNLHPKPLKLAHYGDATTTLLGASKRDRLIATLKDPALAPFDAILFSGGGNDLVGDAFRFWLKDAASVGHDPANAVNTDALQDIMDIVKRAYLDLIDIRNQYARSSYLFFHQYDFATPTNASICDGLVGPWLHPSFADRGWTTFEVDPRFFTAGRSIVSTILCKFATMLGELPTIAENVIVVRTQSALNPDNEDWANELHPTHKGFAKIAEKFQEALHKAFGDRATPH
ncbi:hypothetical protein [Burkholderia sp. USMB20]|uniref:hypothetical protein n=1 Tax=Burkholderia sp. USMB20 TaxID=1571773 RepID=UPI000A9F0184|nr:hypothetical protein [Burkholderia sp. USMB20]TGN93124.1 hypothetical protein PL79_031450 [Burkholderia sp. USMB20]